MKILPREIQQQALAGLSCLHWISFVLAALSSAANVFYYAGIEIILLFFAPKLRAKAIDLHLKIFNIQTLAVR
jgi:hypothetical protein